MIWKSDHKFDTCFPAILRFTANKGWRKKNEYIFFKLEQKQFLFFFMFLSQT